jgi:hypothetical protein
MKALLAVLTLLTVAISGCAHQDSAARGVWVVTGVRLGGVSAMSEDEAKKWIGRSLSIGGVSSALEGERITGCRVTESEFETKEYFEEGFKIAPSQLGFDDPRVRVFEVQCSDGRAWTAPGATIIVGKKQVLTCWDGVFFVLQKRSNSPASPRRQRLSDFITGSGSASTARLGWSPGI